MNRLSRPLDGNHWLGVGDAVSDGVSGAVGVGDGVAVLDGSAEAGGSELGGCVRGNGGGDANAGLAGRSLER